MNFRLNIDDFKLLCDYVDKKTNGDDLVISFNHINNLIIKTKDKKDNDVTITFFNKDSGLFAKIDKQIRLKEELNDSK